MVHQCGKPLHLTGCVQNQWQQYGCYPCHTPKHNPPHGSKQRGDRNWLYHFLTQQSRPINHTQGDGPAALTASMPLPRHRVCHGLVMPSSNTSKTNSQFPVSGHRATVTALSTQLTSISSAGVTDTPAGHFGTYHVPCMLYGCGVVVKQLYWNVKLAVDASTLMATNICSYLFSSGIFCLLAHPLHCLVASSCV